MIRFQASSIAAFLEIIAEGKIAQHFEKSVVARGVADIVEIIVLAAGAHAFLRGRGAAYRARFSMPVKTFLNWTMPALVNINVGSLRGTSGEEATISWPFFLKKSRKADLISLTPFISSYPLSRSVCILEPSLETRLRS